MQILTSQNLCKYYGSGENMVKALDNVSVSIDDGEFVSIIGTSGSGKSTLLNMLGGLDRPTSGEVYVKNKKLSDMNDEELTIFRRRNIGFIFQNYNLVPVLNVYENIVLPIELDGTKVDKNYIQTIIKTLGLNEKVNAMPNQLSGGQQQRVAIARALAAKPAIIINEKTGRKKDIKVGVCASSDDNALLEIGYYWCTVGAPEYVLVSQSVINELSDSPHVETIIANCSPENEESVRMQIKQLTQHNISIPSVAHIQIKSEELEEFRSSILSMRTMTSGICAILILIGIINFINVMLTGIFTRRNELAVMESIGMTKKQVRKMLIFEGFYYALITDSLILTLGSGIVYIFGKLSLKIADYAIFSYPWQLIICISLIILIICILVPAAVYRIVAKNSVTDRLRSTE